MLDSTLVSEDIASWNGKPTRSREAYWILGCRFFILRYKSSNWKILIYLSFGMKDSLGLILSLIQFGTPYLKRSSLLLVFMVPTVQTFKCFLLNRLLLLNPTTLSLSICQPSVKCILWVQSPRRKEKLNLVIHLSLLPWIYHNWWVWCAHSTLFFPGITLSLT